MHPLVSVIIPNYNYGKYVAEAIQSVFGQDYQNVEVIVIDNGSTDNSKEVIQSIKNPRLKAIFHENKGQSGARNSGLSAVNGEFIAFLDADDVWYPEKLAKQMPLFNDPEIGMVYCGLKKTDTALRDLPEAPIMPKYKGNVLKLFATEAGSVICGGESTAVVRAALMKKCGEFDLRLSIGTGWDFWRRIASVAKVDFIPETLVYYRQHGNNLSRRLDIYSHDTELKLAKMFADPASQEAHHLKNKAYAKHRMALAGAYFQNKKILPAIYWGIRAAFSHPGSIKQVFLLPARYFKRMFA